MDGDDGGGAALARAVVEGRVPVAGFGTVFLLRSRVGKKVSGIPSSCSKKRREPKQNQKKNFLSYRPLDLYSVLKSSSAPCPGLRQHETQCSYSEQHCAVVSQPVHEKGRGVAVVEVDVVPAAALLLLLFFLLLRGQQPVTEST